MSSVSTPNQSIYGDDEHSPLLTVARRSPAKHSNYKTYNVLVALQILLGCWPGTSRTVAMLNATLLNGLLLTSIVLQAVVQYKNSEYHYLFSCLLETMVVLPTAAFAYIFFHRRHGFEKIVGMLKVFFSEPWMRDRQQQQFDWVAVWHIGVFAVVTTVVTALQTLQYHRTNSGHHAFTYDRGVSNLLYFSFAVRVAFQWCFLMFFSLVCSVLQLIVEGFTTELSTSHQHGTTIKKQQILHRTVVNISEAFQGVVALNLLLCTLHLTSDVFYAVQFPVDSTMFITGLLQHCLKVYVLLIPPAMTSTMCARVLDTVAGLRADAELDGGERERLELDATLQYLAATHHSFAFTFFGVPVRPAFSVTILFCLFLLVLVGLRQSLIAGYFAHS